MKKSILVDKRMKARELKKKHWSNRKIAHYLVCNRLSVKKWLEMGEEDIVTDRRGKHTGGFKHNNIEETRIMEIREQLESQEGTSIGSKTIKLRYKNKFGQELSEWFINKTIKKYKEAGNSHRGERLDSLVEECPLRKLRKFGRAIMCVDFIGMKHPGNAEAPTFFLCCRYVHPHNLGIVTQVSSQSGEEVIRILKYVWRSYIKPDLVRMSYNSAFGGHLSRQRCLGKLPAVLLNLGIIPFYAPALNACKSIDLEHINSVFSDQFSQVLKFVNQKEIDLKIENFYLEYRRKSDSDFGKLKTQMPFSKSIFSDVDLENRNVNNFRGKKIFFLHTAKPKSEKDVPSRFGIIKFLATEIELDVELIDSTVLCKLDLKKRKLFIYHEKDTGKLLLLKRMDFLIENFDYSNA